jgi:carbamoyl-phosphate synthase large subunit
MKINVLITGIGGAGVGRQIIKALQMSSLDVKLFGSDTSDLSFGKEDVDVFKKFPFANSSDYISEVLNFCKENLIQIIFPGSEKELFVLSKLIELFKENGIIIPVNSLELIEICSDKFRCNEFLLSNGFHCPKSVEIKVLADIEKVTFFPVVLKPMSGAGGSSNVMIAQDVGELKLFTSYLLKNGIEIIAQEYIGNSDQEYTVGVLCSKEKNVINSIVMKRLINSGIGFKLGVVNRTNKEELGEKLVISSGLSQGEFIDRSMINEVCEEIALKLGATSAINIQGRLHNGNFYIFEINPRFSGTTSSRARVGYNEPEIILKNEILLDKVECNFKYNTGFVLRGLEERRVFPS